MVSLKCGRAAPQLQRFDKAVYQEMLAALRPLTPPPRLNTVLILPDGDEIMRGMFERFDKMAQAGGILRVSVLFPSVSVVIQDPTSDK